MFHTRIDFSEIKPEALTKDNYSPTFDCSYEDTMGLNEFYHKEALNYQKERCGKTFIFFYDDKTIGFITMSMNAIERNQIKEKNGKLPFRLREYPAVLIGRIAVDNKWRSMHIGEHICKWAIGYSIYLSDLIGCRYIILQTDEIHKGFYEKLKFKLYLVELNEDKLLDYWYYHKLDI